MTEKDYLRCGNCKHWGEDGRYGNHKTKVCGTTDSSLTSSDMTCPRHELKVVYPEWIPEFHPGSELPKFIDGILNMSKNVLGFYNSDSVEIVYWDEDKWICMLTGEVALAPDFWTYLPEGWE